MYNFTRLLSNKWLVLAGIWLFATVFNINKAYHIDDAAYLETARLIMENPSHPMSGLVNWAHNAEPVFQMNHPHLYFYLLAGWAGLFGFGEVVMHCLQALFTALCIFLIYRIAEIFNRKSALWLTAFLTVNPAFVVGQNLMTDIPLLATWLAFFYCLLYPGTLNELKRWVGAGFLAGAACLIKYPSIILVVIMTVFLLLQKQYRWLWTIAIPLGILALWSWFNYWDYGSIHIFNRPMSTITAERVLNFSMAWLICLGAVVPYSVVFIYQSGELPGTLKRFINSCLVLIIAVTVVMISGVALTWIPEKVSTAYLHVLFFANGALMILRLIWGSGKKVGDIPAVLRSRKIVLLLWLISGAGFIILFSPFMATRHVLIVLVPLTLLLADSYPNLDRGINRAALTLTVLLTVMLGSYDWRWADYYRQHAYLIRNELPEQARVYFSGHWGWQWYAKQNNMIQLESRNPQLQPGDYLVYPKGISQQYINPTIQLELIKVYQEPYSSWNLFSTGDRALFYSSSHKRIPWIVTRRPFAPIEVYKVM